MIAARVTRWGSEVPAEVHSRVERGDLVSVAVEHQRLTLEELADAAFASLAPSRVIDLRVHVGVEAVLVGSGDAPGSLGLVFPEADLDDRLAALEAILPGH